MKQMCKQQCWCSLKGYCFRHESEIDKLMETFASGCWNNPGTLSKQETRRIERLKELASKDW